MSGQAPAAAEANLNQTPVHNVGQLLTQAAAYWPDHPAVAEPHGNAWRSLTYLQLEQDCNRIANGLVENGITKGVRLVLLVPPGIDFVTLVFALFKTGAEIILIDPGIGRQNLVKCISDARPDGVVGVAKAQVARWVYRRQMPNAKLNFVVGRRYWPKCKSIEKFRKNHNSIFDVPSGNATDRAAIIFTSGSTGPPKGVSYEHGNFITQTYEIRDYFEMTPGGADVSGFPLFALFNTAIGKTTVFPKMNFTRPADVDPQRFIQAAEDWKADQSFGSPALWNTVSRWCIEHHATLPTIQRVMTAGAPVPAHVLRRVKKIIAPAGEVYTPYGMTEALPVASNSASIVINETASKTDRGEGVCVGGRFANIRWMIIDISDEPIASISSCRELAIGQIGELIVSGPVVTREYVTQTSANALHKIADEPTFWHRTGDVGYFDEHGRFWFCGRKSQRVITDELTLFTVPCESIINTHPAIYRSALVGIGPRTKQTPVVVAQPWPEHWPSTEERRKRLIRELSELAQRHDKTKVICHVLLKRDLPVDIRHNSKIFREKIADWAADKIGE